MPDQTTIAVQPHPALAGRVATLARLIEAHPAFDLLAEYEAVFLDRHPCAGEAIDCLERAAQDLLERIDATIALLEVANARHAAAPPSTSLEPERKQSPNQSLAGRCGRSAVR